MFKWGKTLDVITLFHKASTPASVRVHAILKTASANAAEHATEDQASDHSPQTTPRRTEFNLDVTEEPPTEDQLKNIIDFLGAGGAGKVVKGSNDLASAIKILKQSKDAFQVPVTVDWDNGRAVAGSNESEILKMVQALPKDS